MMAFCIKFKCSNNDENNEDSGRMKRTALFSAFMYTETGLHSADGMRKWT